MKMIHIDELRNMNVEDFFLINITDNFLEAQKFLKTISRLSDLRSGSHRKDIVELRRRVRDILRKEYGLSYPAIARINIGYKTHSGAVPRK